MVTGPEEIFEKMKENEEGIIREIEKRIEARLAEAKKEANAAVRKFTVDVGDLAVNNAVERAIKGKYLLAGWKAATLRVENFRNETEKFIDLEA